MKYTDTQIEALIESIKKAEQNPDLTYDLDDDMFQEDYAFLEGYQDGRKGREDRAECAYENLIEKMEEMNQ